MAEITQVRNPLYGANTCGGGSLSTPYVTQVHFEPGELTPEENEHAKSTARTCFYRLVWYIQEMNKKNCTYKQAVVTVNKRKP